MSRHKTEKSIRLALFPFLSVITCVIGVLALVLASSVLGQMEESQLDTEDFDKKMVTIQQQRADVDQLAADLAQNIPDAKDCLAGEQARLADAKLQLKDAKAQVAQAKQEVEANAARRAEQRAKLVDIQNQKKEAKAKAAKVAGGVPAAEEELKNQKGRLDKAKIRLAKLKELEQEGARAVSRFADVADNPAGIENEKQRLEREINALGVKLAGVNQQAEQLAEQKPGDNITILSGGSGRGKPVFIECRERDLAHRPSGLVFPRSETGYPLTGFKGFADFLKAMRNERNRAVVFLIRPDAVDTFEVARMQARESGLIAGFLALPGQAPLKIEDAKPNP